MLHPRERTLVRYADGEISEAGSRAVASHLLRCARCRRVTETYAALRGSVAETPEPPDGLLERALARRATGERVLLSTGETRATRSVWRVVALAGAGAAAVGLVSLIPAGHSESNVEVRGGCMAGVRSMFSAVVLGSGLACADVATMLDVPDSPDQPVTSLVAGRVMAGRYVYESVKWTDGLVSRPSGRNSYTLRPGGLDGVPVWEAKGTHELLYANGRYARRHASEAWFERTTLDGIRYVGYRPDGRPAIDVEITRDSMIQRLRLAGGEWRRNARRRGPGISLLGWSTAQVAAVFVSLPLAPGWAGQVRGASFAVVGREEITVPAGTFRCWRLESPEVRRRATGPGSRWVVSPAQRVWVMIERPLVVKYESGPIGDRDEMVLVSFEPESPGPGRGENP